MKTLVLLIAFAGWLSAVFGQDSTSNLLSSDDLLQKSAKQKKTARTLLITGGLLAATAIIIPNGALVEEGICLGPFCSSDEYKNSQLKGIVSAAAIAAALGSIPFYRAASKNKRRASAITGRIKLERAPSLLAGGMTVQRFPAVSVRWQWH